MPHKGCKTLSVKIMCKIGEQKKVTFYAKKPSLFVLKILINRNADHFFRDYFASAKTKLIKFLDWKISTRNRITRNRMI